MQICEYFSLFIYFVSIGRIKKFIETNKKNIFFFGKKFFLQQLSVWKIYEVGKKSAANGFQRKQPSKKKGTVRGICDIVCCVRYPLQCAEWKKCSSTLFVVTSICSKRLQFVQLYWLRAREFSYLSCLTLVSMQRNKMKYNQVTK